MNRISWTILIGTILAFVITLPLTANLISAQAKIIYFPVNENNTRLIVNTDNLTQTLVNATTNETISVEKLTIYRPNATANETITTDTGNATTNINLTAKFNALQGK